MKNTRKSKKPATAEAIANMAEQGNDVSRYFTNKGRMVGPIQRVNVDFTSLMLEELDQRAEALNISRQAVIKTMLRQALDQHYLAALRSPVRQKGRNDDREELEGAARGMELDLATFKREERELEDRKIKRLRQLG